MQTLKKQAQGTSVVLGSGNFYFKKQSQQDSVVAQKSAKKIARACRKIGYTAISAGALDLAAHYAESRDGDAGFSMPFISLNAAGDSGKPLFAGFTTVLAGNSRIGITALTGKAKSPIQVLDWRPVLAKNLPVMREKFDFIILLSDLSTRENKEIAKNYPGIDLIISSDPNINNLSPSMISKTLITQTKPLGQYLGVLDLELTHSQGWKRGYFVLNSLARKEQVLAYKIRQQQKNGGTAAEIALLQEEKAQIPAKRAARSKQLSSESGWGYSLEFMPITALLLEDPVIKSIVD